LTQFWESVQTVSDQIAQIATSVEEQSRASEDVARNIEATATISKDMEKMSDGVIHEVGKLVDVAGELRTATSDIKT